LRLANDPAHDHHTAATLLEERFAGYVPVGPFGEPEITLLGASYAYDAHVFGGVFPALTFEEASGATFEGRTDRSRLPARWPFSGRVYAPAVIGVRVVDGEIKFDDATDARASAMHDCRKVFAYWHEALRRDLRGGLRHLVQDAAVTNVEMGDADALGNPLLDESGENVLMCYRWTVEVVP
jgi:hypothetical protein